MTIGAAPFGSVFDPMTLLTFEQMRELIDWYENPELGSEIELENNTCSGGKLRVVVDHCGIWVDPIS